MAIFVLLPSEHLSRNILFSILRPAIVAKKQGTPFVLGKRRMSDATWEFWSAQIVILNIGQDD
jgi:hypothetical protein